MLALLIAASEPSKVPIYIAGAILVVWAIGVSTLGINRPDFPGSVVAQRAVIGVSVVLAALTIAMAIVTSK